MNIIEISSKEITLSGVLLNSSLILSNPHVYLAVMFQLESKPNILDIEPQRGMIMHKDQKYIKINLKSHLREESHKLQNNKNVIVLRATYFCEYNKKQKNKQDGWSYISIKIEEVNLPVKMNVAQERQKIRRSIKEQDLQKSRKSNSFQKFRNSSIKKVKNSKLNEDLDFIFRNQEFKQKYMTSKQDQFKIKPQNIQCLKSNTSPQLFKTFTQQKNTNGRPDKVANGNFGPLLSPQQEYYVNNLTQKKDYIQTFSNKYNNNRKNQVEKPSNRRALDLIILAVIAAFSLSLGEIVGRFLKY